MRYRFHLPLRVSAAIGRGTRSATPWVARTALSIAICWAAGGPRNAAFAAPVTKAWFDARGVCIFPLSPGALPTSREELNDSLVDAWRDALTLPDPTRVVLIQGGRYPAVDTLRIDLSDAKLPSNTNKEKVRPDGKPRGRLGVARFELVGQPLLCDDAKLNVSLSADRVRLDLEHDKTGRPILLLADAQAGTLKFDATPHDLERVVLSSARIAAAPYGVSIVSTNLKINAKTTHSVTAVLHVATRVGFIPAGMTFKAHVDIDDAMNAKLTDLKIDGDDILGPLIVGLLRPGLAKFEGKTRPLISFPSRDMHLHDVQITVDDKVHLNAAFGN